MAEDPASRLWATADLVTPMAVRVAATLGIAGHIAAGRTTLAEIAATAGADPGALDRLLRHLVNVGLLGRDEPGGYSLTNLGDVLRDDHPSRLRDRLDIDGPLGRAELAFAHLLHSVRTGDAAFPALYGRDFWDDLAGDPTRAARYDEQMAADVAAWAPTIIAAYDWRSLGHIVDVGGGNGALLIVLLRAFPGLRGTIVELPATAQRARNALEAAGLGGRSDVVAGSFFDPLPAGAGGYLLTAIIHNWDDEPARAIFRRAGEAAGRDGRVFVIEKIGADARTPGTAMDLRMLAYFSGRERSLDALMALCSDVGLDVLAVHDAGNGIVVVELRGI